MTKKMNLLKIEPLGDRLPPNQQLVAAEKWPVIGERTPAAGHLPQLKIHGEVAAPQCLSVDQLECLPQSTLQLDLHCVTRWSKFDLVFTGVLLADLLEVIQPKSTAHYVSFIAHSERRHSSSLTLADALRLKTLIATQVGGQPLPVEHGGPIRNLVPNRYLYKSVKWLCELEFLAEDRLGYWEAESGYHNTADPWLEQRYLAPSLDRRAAAKLLESRDFSGHDLLSIDASQRELNGLKAVAALLRNANFRLSQLQQADFSGANLSNAHFEGAVLRGANFSGADLEGACFTGADLRGANFTGSSLFGASFFSAAPAGLADSPQAGQGTGFARIDQTTMIPPECLPPLTPEQLAFVTTALQLGRE
ncbi:MAG: pentapeptide repeat-containing protein [Planctomycetota bacterium]|jgi:DMSO/TMAO reductase YedYZ molybdopterin-dependent catalytic subunit